ncbi:uracil-DNA glycosylase [Pseudovibrio sp. Tun.PSC04-5.I4]|uniref:uracil-DNA glycosylase n=1 Tax=Pseudovibrio sp. Tun.PSC04-5.I4 TaxID=1798213 RepID=UPI000881E5C0|nr:uracil-DNA glycosylase [Pseudovibrio sp. Tun.PSC04-5.I4]SDQ81193.1 DNA polymerase [Pseudovibrio sp. Tun.PSC04-5.I4]
MSEVPVANAAEIETYLEFLSAVGVDCALEEAPVDRFAQTQEQARPVQQQPLAQASSQPIPIQRQPKNLSVSPAEMARNMRENGVPPGAKQAAREILERQKAAREASVTSSLPTSVGDGSAVIPDAETVEAARNAASSAKTMDDLRRILTGFDGCNLRLTAKNLVFGDGNPNAKIMFIGEAPGRDEDLQGVPFVGRSGHLLDRMLKAIHYDRSNVYLTNVMPWRPPGNRTPTPQETEICRPFIQQQIELVDPELVVFLGAASAKTLSGVRDGIRKLRGRWLSFDGEHKQRRAIATYHPADLLRSPAEKRFAWRDMLQIRAELDTTD